MLCLYYVDVQGIIFGVYVAKFFAEFVLFNFGKVLILAQLYMCTLCRKLATQFSGYKHETLYLYNYL